MRRARSLAVLLLFAGGTLSSAPARAGAGGGTNVSIDGTVVTFDVPLDICCAADASEALTFGPILQEYARLAEKRWNDALANLKAKGCFTIKVKIDLALLKTGDKQNPAHHHATINFNEAGRPGFFDPTTRDHTEDLPSALRQPFEGNFFLPNLDDKTVAHEVGHLMGLGDDYQDGVLGGHGNSVALPGREGTLMDTGEGIDQNLADRLGDLAGSAVKLPDCLAGTIDATSRRDYISGGQHDRCTDAWTGVLAFVVDSKSTIKGDATLSLKAPAACTFASGNAYPDPDRIHLAIAGTDTASVFKFHFRVTGYEPASGVAIAGITTLYVAGSVCRVAPGPTFTMPHPAIGSAETETPFTAKGSLCAGSSQDLMNSQGTIKVHREVH